MKPEISVVPTNGHGARLAGRTRGWNHWTTPQVALAPVRRVDRIKLDPCGNANSVVEADVTWCGEDGDCVPSTAHGPVELRDGLQASWNEAAEGGLVFVNPPYSDAAKWIAKACVEGELGTEIIALVAARTDTRWTHHCFRFARALCFWGPGRIRFGNPPPGSAGDAPSIPSMFVYWGKRRGAFLKSFREHGMCFDLVEARAPRSFPVRS